MILSSLSKFRDLGLLFLRVGIGVMMIVHGFPKLAGGTDKWHQVGQAMTHLGIDFFPVFWGLSCAMVETLGGVFLILGFSFSVSPSSDPGTTAWTAIDRSSAGGKERTLKLCFP